MSRTPRDIVRQVREQHPTVGDPRDLAPAVAAAWKLAGMEDEVLVPAAVEMISEQQRSDAARNLSRGSAPIREFRPAVRFERQETRTYRPAVTWIETARKTQLFGDGRWIALDEFTAQDCEAYAEKRHGQAVAAVRRAEQMERVLKALEHAGVGKVADLPDEALSEALAGEIPE